MALTTLFNVVLISDWTTYDTGAANLFQQQLLNFLKEKCSWKKIVFFPDGNVPQYKKWKNFANLIFQKPF